MVACYSKPVICVFVALVYIRNVYIGICVDLVGFSIQPSGDGTS